VFTVSNFYLYRGLLIRYLSLAQCFIIRMYYFPDPILLLLLAETLINNNMIMDLEGTKVIFSRRLPHFYAPGTPRYDLRVHESK